MALAATGIGGVVTHANASSRQSGRAGVRRSLASCSVVEVSKRALTSASSAFREERSGKCERRCIASRSMVCRASTDSTGVAAPMSPWASAGEGDEDPKPVVLIDQDSDAEATVVEISFGNRLGALLDTIKALQNLGLNVVKGVIVTESPGLRRKKFLVTRSHNNKKVEDPEVLEAIRLTIINNLLQYHPESGEQLAMGVALGGVAPAREVSLLAEHSLFGVVDFGAVNHPAPHSLGANDD